MLGEHDGTAPLVDDAEKNAVARAALPAMARLKAGKDVPARKKLIARALAQISEADPYWIESFASGLTGEDGIGAAEAQAVALTGAWSVRDSWIASQMRLVNAHGSDPYSGQVLQGLMSAAPEFGKRVTERRVDSDEVVLRVWLAHLFRRNASTTMQLFVVDAAARLLPKAMKMSVALFMKNCLERFDEDETPTDSWGYVVVLHALRGRSGYFLSEPTEEGMAELARMKEKIQQMMGGNESQEALKGHMMAAAVSGYLQVGRVGEFASLAASVLKDNDMRFGVIYARDDEGGTHTQLLEIPASSADEARRIVGKMPEIRMHDDFRRMTEYLEQMRETEDIAKHS